MRPCSSETDELERLEGAHCRLASALECAGILAVRIRQVERRAPAELLKAIRPAQDELGTLVDKLDAAHSLLQQLLDERQSRRAERERDGPGERELSPAQTAPKTA